MQELADRIERQKALAIKNRERLNRICLTCVIAGFFLSVFILITFNTAIEKTLFSGIVISALLGAALGPTKPGRGARCVGWLSAHRAHYSPAAGPENGGRRAFYIAAKLPRLISPKVEGIAWASLE